MTEESNRVLQTIDGMADEIVDAVSRLVQVPSVNPKYPGTDFNAVLGGESSANALVAEWYEDLGADVDVWAEEPKRNNVVGVVKGSGGGRSLILNGHIDTVPEGRHEDWHEGNPFSGRVASGRIYGRGACDMKSGVVAQTMAAAALQRAGIRLRGDLILESVVGEEVMDHEAGTTATVRRGYRADGAIVSEPSGAEVPLAVAPASGGAIWMTITCEGYASHASVRGETFRAGGAGSEVAVNAIDKGVYILNSLLKLEQEWGLTKRSHLYKPGYCVLLPGVISGAPHGVGVPFIISEYCTIEYAVWHHPEEDVEAVKAEVEAFVRHAAALDEWLRDHPPEIRWNLYWPPFSIEEGHPLTRTVMAAHEQAASGSRIAGPASLRGLYCVCDATFLQDNGIPSLSYGPGSLLHAHAKHEYVEIDEVLVATKAIALAAMEWCG
jgi:acetylornithine deacetylase